MMGWAKRLNRLGEKEVGQIGDWAKRLESSCSKFIWSESEQKNSRSTHGAFRFTDTPENTPTKFDFIPKETIYILFYN